MVDMTGKRVIITGGTNGIGEATALQLAKMGAAVTVISRSEERLANTVEKIQSTGGSADAIQADLSSIQQTRAAAAAYINRHDRLDVLINNAGAPFTERHESVDGIEMNIALHHLSYFLLSTTLLDLLKQTAAQHGEARIVNVSSEAHRIGMNWRDIQFEKRFIDFNAYGQSKAMNIMFTKALARRLAGTGVTVNALHPGVVKTGFSTDNDRFFKLLSRFAKDGMKTIEEGAQTSVYLASSPDAKGVTGKYFVDSSEQPASKDTDNEENQERLWAMTETWLAGH